MSKRSSKLSGRRDPQDQTPFKPGDEAVVCDSCGVAYHVGSWHVLKAKCHGHCLLCGRTVNENVTLVTEPVSDLARMASTADSWPMLIVAPLDRIAEYVGSPVEVRGTVIEEGRHDEWRVLRLTSDFVLALEDAVMVEDPIGLVVRAWGEVERGQGNKFKMHIVDPSAFVAVGKEDVE